MHAVSVLNIIQNTCGIFFQLRNLRDRNILAVRTRQERNFSDERIQNIYYLVWHENTFVYRRMRIINKTQQRKR